MESSSRYSSAEWPFPPAGPRPSRHTGPYWAMMFASDKPLRAVKATGIPLDPASAGAVGFRLPQQTLQRFLYPLRFRRQRESNVHTHNGMVSYHIRLGDAADYTNVNGGVPFLALQLIQCHDPPAISLIALRAPWALLASNRKA